MTGWRDVGGMDEFDEQALAVEHAAVITGSTAFLLVRLGLWPELDLVAARLDAAGVAGTARAERWRARTLMEVESVRRRGQAWHAAHRGDDQVAAGSSAVVPSPAGGGGSVSMAETMTTGEAAARLGCTPRRVVELVHRGKLAACRDAAGRWELDAAGVEARAAELEKR